MIDLGEAWSMIDHNTFRTSITRLAIAGTAADDAPSHSTATAAAAAHDYTYRSVTLYKPMGLILQEADEQNDDDEPATTSGGIKIAAMSGASARASQGGVIDLCVGDTVVKVGTQDCTCWTFDQVMEAIANEPEPVELLLRRDADAIPVKFLETGVCIAAKPGMSIGALGFMAKTDIPYSCRNGGCGTCQQVMVTHSRNSGRGISNKERVVRPCVAKVPEGVDLISIIPCNGEDTDSCLLHN